MRLPRRDWTEMTTTDFSAAAADVGAWIAVLPVAAVEQHGPHLPLGVDAVIGRTMLARALDLVGEDIPVTVLPLQAIGASAEHEDFPGTLSISSETAIRLWTEIGSSVARAGVKKLVLVNSHGGNSPALDIVARTLRMRHGMLAVFTSWARLGYPGELFSAQEIRHGIHGGEIETALMRAFAPELVRMDEAQDFSPATLAMEQEFSHLRAGAPAGFGWMSQDLHPSGAIGDASAATAEAGEAAAAHGAVAFAALLADVHAFPLERLAAGPLKR